MTVGAMPCWSPGRPPLTTTATPMQAMKPTSRTRAIRGRSTTSLQLVRGGSERQRRPRIVQQGADVGKEPRAQLAVDDPVVEGQRQLRHLPDPDLPLVHPR